MKPYSPDELEDLAESRIALETEKLIRHINDSLLVQAVCGGLLVCEVDYLLPKEVQHNAREACEAKGWSIGMSGSDVWTFRRKGV